jgi:hypothetical protein
MSASVILLLAICIGSISWAAFITVLWAERGLVIDRLRNEIRVRGRKVPDFVAPMDKSRKMIAITTDAQPAPHLSVEDADSWFDGQPKIK